MRESTLNALFYGMILVVATLVLLRGIVPDSVIHITIDFVYILGLAGMIMVLADRDFK